MTLQNLCRFYNQYAWLKSSEIDYSIFLQPPSNTMSEILACFAVWILFTTVLMSQVAKFALSDMFPFFSDLLVSKRRMSLTEFWVFSGMHGKFMVTFQSKKQSLLILLKWGHYFLRMETLKQKMENNREVEPFKVVWFKTEAILRTFQYILSLSLPPLYYICVLPLFLSIPILQYLYQRSPSRRPFFANFYHKVQKSISFVKCKPACYHRTGTHTTKISGQLE